uniref:Putative aberrant root formation protein n=1 Tax=Lupinus angustifolius TaxID=3871 RepID=A0A182BF92_LUPAN|nr:putative aberrant root formation protein [Lupinus angustifolius]
MSVKSREVDVSFEASEAHNNLRNILHSCSKFAQVGDLNESGNAISELLKFLDSLLDASLSEPDNQHVENDAFEALAEIHRYICSSTNQEVVDALSFELPKAVSKFASISSRFFDKADSIIDQFITKCGPRDMLSILCNTLGYSSEMTKAASYIVLPLAGLSKVFVLIKRRQFEQAKEAIPIILNVLTAVSLESEDEELEGVFERAVEIANSIYEVCNKLALVSVSLSYQASSCHSLVLQLSQISSNCGLSYLSLLTTYDVETVAGSVFGEEVARTAKEDLVAIKDELCNNLTERWQAIGTLRHVLSFVNFPWELKKHTIEFLLCITVGGISGNNDDKHVEWSSYMPTLFAALQAVKMIIMYTPDPELRKKSFAVLKGVLADIPISQRFDILKALITNTDSSSMVLSALNLYRFVLMTESTGKTNRTGVVSRSSLLKVYNEWLLPLRTLVTGIIAENKNDYDELAVDTLCTLNPLELVLYRCIELVEEKLQQSS